MRNKETMNLALEALNVAEHFVEEYAASKYYFAHIAAKTALEEALAKQEQSAQHVGEPVATVEDNSQCWAGMNGMTAYHLIERHADNWADVGKMMHEWLSANTAPQPKQKQGEPVAWRNAAIRVGEDLCSVGPHGYYDMTAEQWLDWALSVVTVHLPPQPSRKPLTDEQKHELVTNWFAEDWAIKKAMGLLDDYEAAHGIKE